MSKKLEWHTEKRTVCDLIPFEMNPRKMSAQQARELEASLSKFNLVEIPAINTDGTIIAGHQRVSILKLLGRDTEEIEVRIPSRKLTDEELAEYNIRSNKNTGSWDWDVLVNFDIEMLQAVGFEDYELERHFDPHPNPEPKDPKGGNRIIECPSCGHEFSVLEKK